MLPHAFLLLQAAVAAPVVQGSSTPAFDVPRSAAEAEVDGNLTESSWSQAARLTGFFQYEPSDGQPATQPTEVRVFYTAKALYFGIVAGIRPGANINATVSS